MPPASATAEPAVVAADEPADTPTAETVTCEATTTNPSGPPTIAPIDEAPPADDDNGNPCDASGVPETAVPESLTATPEATISSAVVVPDATATLAESPEPVETPADRPVGGEVATTTAAIVEVPAATDTPVAIVPDDATSPANDGVSVPGNDTATATGESTGVDGLDAAEVVVSALPAGNAPGGPLAVSPDQSRFVVGTNGVQYWIVDFDGNQVPINGSEPFYPVWSPDGSQLLIAYYPDNPDESVLGVVDAATGGVTSRSTPSSESTTRDVPAGWLGQTPVFQRTYLDDPSRGIELWRAGDDAPFWTLAGEQAHTAYPISLGQSFLLATSMGWLEVEADGTMANLGPSPIKEQFSEYALTPDGMIAYAGQGQLVMASIFDPGTPLGTRSYPNSGGGFDWSPSGDRLVIANGSALTFVTPQGETVAELENASGGTVSGPYWTSQGVLFIDSASNTLQRVAAPEQ